MSNDDRIGRQRLALGQIIRAVADYYAAGGKPEAVYAAVTGVYEGSRRPSPEVAQPAPSAPSSAPRDDRDDDRVMSFAEWCLLNGFSHSTGQRIIAAGKGPIFINLSMRRKGVTVGENRRWQAIRVRYR